MTVSLAVSLGIFGLIAIREWLPLWLKIWHIMLAGAVVMLATRQISPSAALAAIDWNIIAYLFGAFSIGSALYLNGVSHKIADRFASFASARASLTAFVFGFALLAAILTNDAAAIIGTPIALVLAVRAGVDPRTFLIALCVAVTIGSMATPIGNPQNLLIATSGHLPAPLLTFLLWLAFPTILCLGLAAWLLARTIRSGGVAMAGVWDAVDQEDGRLWPSLLAVGLLVVLVLADSVVATVEAGIEIPLGLTSCLAATPIYLFGPKRRQTFRQLDWSTLVFFVAMFIVTTALLESGSLQHLLGDLHQQMTEPIVTAGIAFFGSHVFSNVPLVDMYLKILESFSTANLMMLAAASTLAGNVFIISAASNVIVVQQAESLGAPSITFTEFTKAVLLIGVVSTIISVGWVYVMMFLLGRPAG
ncbi:MAG: SLC13 family permease [Pseudomonadota bacterium]